jgi:DNA (cytosine-5)-methyltransferase 1
MNDIAYYNEINKDAAAWLRELIKHGHIAPGIVDERSIEDVLPSDLIGFTQCHFFAGIGIWSYALRCAGWPDDRPVWTGSCPCQPFSQAGEGSGFADERHLWPHFHWLIQERRPPAVLGEQVASKDADPWVDLVQTDLEGLGYAFGAVAFPSASVGAPHIRDRTFWVAHTDSGAGRKGRANVRGWADRGHAQPWAGSCGSGLPGGLADSDQHGRSAQPIAGVHDAERDAESCGGAGGMANPGRIDTSKVNAGNDPINGERSEDGRRSEFPARVGAGSGASSRDHRTGCSGIGPAGEVADLVGSDPANGIWRDADWLFCRDGKWRPVEPGTFPLAHGAPARVVRLRGYGNGINAIQAQVFIEESGLMS